MAGHGTVPRSALIHLVRLLLRVGGWMQWPLFGTHTRMLAYAQQIGITMLYSELSPAAKQKARDWWIDSLDDNWHECVFDDFHTIAGMIGISVIDIHYSGFWSQGDGASFTGTYSYRAGSAKAVKAHASQDTELHAIADELQAIQKQHGYSLQADIDRGGHCYHSGTMRIDCDELAPVMRRLADWLYRLLEAEYEHQTSEENIADVMSANEYGFTPNGVRCDG